MFADLPAFDAGSLAYDRTKFRFAEWALARVHEAGYPNVDDFSRLHEHVTFEDVPTLTKRLIREAGGADFMRMAVDFIATYVKRMVGDVEVVLFSYYALPEDAVDRRRLLDMRTADDRERIERTMQFSTDFSSPVLRTA